ncbi:MAG: hypothetical protein ACOVOG_03305 [Rubrivivax sp.]|jgi:hypothetical protein|nr:hypothetical protein [Rubrivivax sp.]
MNLDLRHLADDDGAELPPALSAPAPLPCRALAADVQRRNRVALRLVCVLLGLAVLAATVLVSPAVKAGALPASAASQTV